MRPLITDKYLTLLQTLIDNGGTAWGNELRVREPGGKPSGSIWGCIKRGWAERVECASHQTQYRITLLGRLAHNFGTAERELLP